MYTVTATLTFNNLNELYIFLMYCQFSVFSSPELKTQGSFSHCLHAVSLSVNCSSPLVQVGQIQPNIKASLSERNFFFQ